jgi:hypothetical protein
MPRYDDDYSSRRDDHRSAPVRREQVRDDRHRSDRIDQRDRRIVEEPREVPRSSRADPMEVMDSRIPSSRIIADPRTANAGVRLEPRPSRHQEVDPRARDQQPTYYEDSKSSRMIDPRTDVYSSREPAGRYSAPREDRMDTDMDMPPPTRRSHGRDMDSGRDYYVEEDNPRDRSSKYNDYFVSGSGM